MGDFYAITLKVDAFPALRSFGIFLRLFRIVSTDVRANPLMGIKCLIFVLDISTGKFQMQVLSHCGHVVHEDAPDRVSGTPRDTPPEHVNPFTPKSDQFQISPAASPAILHDTVWRTWLFIAYSDGKCFRYQILTTSLIHLSLKGWENALFELGSERVKHSYFNRVVPVLSRCARIPSVTPSQPSSLSLSCFLFSVFAIWRWLKSSSRSWCG